MNDITKNAKAEFASNNLVSNVLDVSPATAARMLAYRGRNRTTSARHIAALVKEMRNGNWKLNGESIKFAKDGSLLDGQHRLAAIIQANVTVKILVTRGLDPVVFDTMDQGRTRTNTDVIRINGGQYVVSLNSAIRAILFLKSRLADPETPASTVYEGTSVRPTEVLAWLQRNPGVYDSCRIGRNLYDKFGAIKPSTWTACVHALKGDSRAEEFLGMLAGGANLPEKHPVLAARAAIVRQHDTQQAVMLNHQFVTINKAWKKLYGRQLPSPEVF